MPKLQLTRLFYHNTIEVNDKVYIRKIRQLKRSIFSYTTINSTSLEIEFIRVTQVTIPTRQIKSRYARPFVPDAIEVTLPVSTKSYTVRDYILSY